MCSSFVQECIFMHCSNNRHTNQRGQQNNKDNLCSSKYQPMAAVSIHSNARMSALYYISRPTLQHQSYSPDVNVVCNIFMINIVFVYLSVIYIVLCVLCMINMIVMCVCDCLS